MTATKFLTEENVTNKNQKKKGKKSGLAFFIIRVRIHSNCEEEDAKGAFVRLHLFKVYSELKATSGK